VARNIAALGARCIFLGVVGEDDASRTLMRALASEPLIESHLVVDASRSTTRKVRFVSEHHSTHLLRADWELAEALNAKTEKALIDRTLAAVPRAASVVFVRLCQGHADTARHSGGHRRSEKGGNTDNRRPESSRLFRLSGRDGDQAAATMHAIARDG
jgi:bifunctional ADP-heptose synthase (sugar kinase/adenylyltransferase)